MSGQTTIPNYRETLFTYPDLTPIHGEPTYETLKTLHNQLKANARAVRTSLGGGNHGYLALVLTPEQYAIVSQIPFVRPQHPGSLQIAPYQLPHIVADQTARHHEAVRLYHECNNVEQALRQQLMKAIDEAYLLALKDRTTQTILAPIYQIIQFLFTNHGKVTQAKLHKEEQIVKSYTFNANEPIDVVFNKLEDLLDLSTAAECGYTGPQIIGMAYMILNKTGKYGEYLRKWNRFPPTQKTWPTFKTTFRQAQTELRETGDLEVNQTEFHSANLIEEIVNGVQRALEPATEEAAYAEQQAMQHMANATTQQQVLPDLMNQMMTMMKQMQDMQTQMLTNNNRTTGNNSKGNRRRRNKSKYCWSHGACAHDSKSCQAKKEGHQDDATFNNKMNGSTAYCE